MSAPDGQEDGFGRLRARLAPFLSDDELIVTALTHRSYCAEHEGTTSNERLEFLGDSVLGLIVTAEIYTRFPGFREGDLARIRADVVSTVALAPLARDLGVGAALLLGRGEEHSGGREKPSLLADALEAIIGAVYLASGMERATQFVEELTRATIDEVSARANYGDAKNRLQELAARLGVDNPVYLVTELGPDHKRRFVARLHFAGADGRGEGHSKKEAEREAASVILEVLGEAGA